MTDELKKVKENLGKKTGKKAPPVKNFEAFKAVLDLLESMSSDATLPQGAVELASKLATDARDHDDSHVALKSIADQIKMFKTALKEGVTENNDSEAEESGE